MTSPAATTDLTILQRIAEGDERAVREAIDAFSPLIWSLARRMSRNHADAEDAVQEIFVSLWRSADRYNPETASESTFVAVIARRKLIDRLRARTRRPEPAAITEAVDLQDNDQAGDGVELTEEARIAREEFNRLSPDQQRVLRLAIYQGCTHEEISRSLDMPLGTVKTHARRGLIRIRESLERRQQKNKGDAGASA